MNELELQIFSSFIDRDRYGIIVHLLSITDLNVGDGYRFPFTSEYHWDSRIPTFPTPENTHIKCQNLSWDLDEEREIIQAALRESGKIILYTNGCTQSQFWKKTLENMQYSTAFLLTPDKFCSLDILGEYITRISFTRKELIFALKMLFWIHSTETSLLDELKYYGEERVLIDFFRSERDEYSLFREKFEASSTHADALICSSLWVSIPTWIGKYHVVIQDIYQLEDTLRREYSQRISFDQLWSDIELLGKQGIFWNTSLEDLSFWLSYFEHLITTIHTRPKWPLTSPPGAHGETYYFDQEMLWKQWGPWLTQVMRILDETVHREKIYTGNTGWIEKKIRKRCLVAIQTLIELTYIRDENCGCILTILEDAVILSLIPRNTAKYVQSSIHSRLGEKTILLQYGKGGPLMRSFLEKECGIYWNAEEKWGHSDHRMETRTDLELLVQDTSSCVILSTSNKHLRQITDEVKKYHPEAKIFTQWLSGGKGKIMSLYEQYSGKKILIGLIDSWIDDSHIWSLTDRVILAKIPFDPPTDPYYLARTVWMKNNFEEYSCPMTLSTINTLIGRISTANPQNQIFCLDDRLTNTPWGWKIWNEVL